VSKQDGLIFGAAGLAAWLAATLFYAAFGGGLLESAFWFYAVNAFLAAAFGTFVFHVTARLRHIRRGKRMLPMLAFIAPGLIGGALVIGQFQVLMPFADPVSLGRYGAFLAVLFVALAASAFERPPQKA
jgi:H+/Cl- antiporter ClcA